MISLSEPYEPRAIRFLELWKPPGWQLKVYGIAYRKPSPSTDLIVAAKNVARSLLSDPISQHAHYGVGFMGIHEGRGSNFVFVDWWANENELHHHVFISPGDDPLLLEDRTRDGPAACVWDLGVLAYEREAWVDTVLSNSGEPDLEAYLARRINQDQ